MNLAIFLIILIALIIIFCIILYNGLRILLTVVKEKGMVKYEFKVTILKIPIFKRTGSEGIIDIIKSKSDEDPKETEKERFESKGEASKAKEGTQDEKSAEPKDKKGLREKYSEIKPTLNELKKSKGELKSFLNNLLKSINLKKLEGNLILGLSDHATTVKIASWIWSIGAIVNSKKPTLLTVEPRFTEEIIDFEGEMELKINLLLITIYSLVLLTKRNIRELIKELYRQRKSKGKEKEPQEDQAQEEVNDVNN